MHACKLVCLRLWYLSDVRLFRTAVSVLNCTLHKPRFNVFLHCLYLYVCMQACMYKAAVYRRALEFCVVCEFAVSLTVQCLCVVGATGFSGPQGARGQPGPAGLFGSPGNVGIQGAFGVTGASGPTGEKGFRGPRGDTGPEGPVGSQGPPGNAGPAGQVGPNGDTGAPGQIGARVLCFSCSFLCTRRLQLSTLFC